MVRSRAQLVALDPQATLDRGYAVVHKDGNVVSTIADVSSGDGLVIKVSDGGFPARVDARGSRRKRTTGGRTTKANGTKPSLGVQPVLFP